MTQFSPALVMPVGYLALVLTRPDGIQDQMFPQQSAIIVAN